MSDNIRNLNMEGATLLDLVAMDVLGALVQSDWGGRLPPEDQPNATQIMVHVSFHFAKEFLRQRDVIINGKKEEPKLDLPPENKIIL